MSLSLLILANACTKEYSRETEYLEKDALDQLIEKSEKPYVLLSFYDPSCKPCVAEFPELARLVHHPHKHLDVHFIAVEDGKQDAQDLEKLWHRLNINNPLYWVDEETLNLFYSAYQVPANSAPPVSLILSKNGRLIKRIHTITDAHEVSMIIHKDESFGH